MTSLDEVVVVIFLAGPAQTPMTVRMFSGLRENISPTILAIATILVLISIVLLTLDGNAQAPVRADARHDAWLGPRNPSGGSPRIAEDRGDRPVREARESGPSGSPVCPRARRHPRSGRQPPASGDAVPTWPSEAIKD